MHPTRSESRSGATDRHQGGNIPKPPKPGQVHAANGHGEPTPGGPPLPLAARRALWERVWDRLLAPPAPEPGAPATAPASSGAAEERGQGGAQ